jgi:hypothetical protein
MSKVKISPKALAEMKADRRRMSPAELAVKYGVPVDFARYHTRTVQPVKRTFLDDRSDEILLLMGIHNSSRKVAEELGVTHNAINKALARME